MSFKLKLFHLFCSQVIHVKQVNLTNEIPLLSQVIEVGKSDDLEDSKCICDDTDVEVASEVRFSSLRW